jgi:hypothetical protein
VGLSTPKSPLLCLTLMYYLSMSINWVKILVMLLNPLINLLGNNYNSFLKFILDSHNLMVGLL